MKSIGIDCVFFSKCNLNCSHCFQNNHNRAIDIDYIRNIPELIISVIEEEVSKKNPELVMLSCRGGEMFQDSIPDSLFVEYESTILKIKDWFLATFPEKQFIIYFMTNGLFEKKERAVKLIKKVGAVVTLSYDSFGRYFSENQIDTVIKTYELFKSEKVLKNVCVTLTKQSITKYLENPEILRRFQETELDFNFYVPTAKKSAVPSDEDLFRFYKMLLDEGFFNSIFATKFMESYCNGNKITPSCNCPDTTIVENGIAHRTCNIYIPTLDLKDFYGDEEFDDSNAVKVIKNRGFKKRGCLLCPYFNNCTQYCWMMLCYKEFEMSDCPHKRIHKYIQDNPEILERYRKWKHLL